MKNDCYLPRYEDSWALVIGINEYLHGMRLEIACADAESIAQALTDDLGFPASNVVTLLDAQATRTNIMEHFLRFDSTEPNDRLFVFFAGHGETISSHRGPVGYLVPVDGNLIPRARSSDGTNSRAMQTSSPPNTSCSLWMLVTAA